jgi:hypothetical protein
MFGLTKKGSAEEFMESILRRIPEYNIDNFLK